MHDEVSMSARALMFIALWACGGAEPAHEPVALPAPSASASATHTDPWTGASLARSNATATAPSSGFRLIVSKSALSLPDGMHIMPVPADASHGVDASYKRNGPNDLYIEPIARVFKTQPVRDAILAVDPGVPYRLLVEVLFTLGQNEVGAVHLLVRSPTGVATIDAIMPHVLPPTSTTTPRLGLTVIVVGDGIAMKARGGNVAPGCKDVGPGLAIPARDMNALATCAERLKNLKPDFADEKSVVVSANPDIDFQTIVTTMDALRPTFPDVTFGLSR